MNLKSLFGLALVSVAGAAGAQQTFNIAGPVETHGRFGFSPLNTTVTVSCPTSFRVGATVTPISGTVTTLNSGSYASEIRMAFFNSTFPGAFARSTSRFFSGDAVATPYSTVTSSMTISGGLVGATVSAGSTWTIEFFESFSDGGAPDGIATNLQFTLNSGAANVLPASVQTIVCPATMNSVGDEGVAANSTFTVSNTATSAFVIGNQFVINAGKVDRDPALADNWASDTVLKLTHDAFPGVSLQSQWGPQSFGSLSTAIAAPTSVACFVTSLAGSTIPLGGTYTVETYEAFDEDTADLAPENVITGLSFRVVGNAAPAVKDSFGPFAGPIPSFDALFDSGNTSLTLGTAGSTYTIGSAFFVDGTLTGFDPDTWASDADLYLTNSALPGLYFFIDPSAVQTFSTVTISTLASGANVSGTMVGATVPAGSSFKVQFFEDFDEVTDGADAEWTNFTLKTTEGTAPVVTPPTSTSLGAINKPSTPVNVSAVGTTPTWFSFTLPTFVDGNAGSYLDVYTTPVSQVGFTTANGTDSEIGLYLPNGIVLGFNDDEGLGRSSALSFGSLSAPRQWQSTAEFPTVFNAAASFNGFNGPDGLPSGTFYLVVGSFNMNFAANFGVTSTATASVFGNQEMYIKTNITAKTTVNATFELGGVDLTGDTVFYKVLDGSGNVLDNGQVVCDGSGNATILVPSSGAYSIRARTRTSLWKQVGGTGTGGTVSTSINLTNGNTDAREDNNEVGPADLQAVLDAFGATPTDPTWNALADLDQDNEIGPGDLQIVLDNFGTEGD